MGYTLQSGRKITMTLPIGGVLTMGAATGSTGFAVRLGQKAGDEPLAPSAYAGSTVTFGPFDEVTRWRLESIAGDIPYDYTNPVPSVSNAYATKYQKTVLAGRASTVVIPAGSILTALATAGASGYIAPVDGTFSNITTYSGAQLQIGPFNSDKLYQVFCVVGSITITTNWFDNSVPDIVAPIITSNNATSLAENTKLAWTLTANETVTWSIRTSAQNAASVDYTKFQLAGNILQWINDGTVDYEAPTDTGANNTYVAVIRATDLAGNSTDQTFTVTVVDQDEIPNAFTFTDVTNATLSTVYTSDSATVAGLGTGVSTPISISGGTYSKNGAAYTSAAGTVVNGDVITLRQTSSPSNSTATNVTLTIGGVSDTWTVTTVAAASVGNLRQPTSKAQAETFLANAVPGDVINCYHGGYDSSGVWALDITTTYASGVNLITHPSQPTKVRCVNKTNVNLEITLSGGSGDAVAGNYDESVTLNDTLYVQNSSGLCISSSKIGPGYVGLRMINSTDITVDHCVIYGSRDDLMKSYSNCQRVRVINTMFRDTVAGSKVFSKFDGTTAQFGGSFQGSPWVQSFDPNHGDGWQNFSGTGNHIWFYQCDLKGYMQGYFHTDDGSGGSQSNVLIEECTFQCAFAYALMITVGDNIEVKNCTFLKHPDAQAPTPAIYLARAGGTGSMRSYGCTLAAGMVPNVPAGINMASGTPTSVGAAVVGPTAPSFTGTLANVGGLTVPRTRPAYAEYSGLPDMKRAPFIASATAAPFTVGQWVDLIPECVWGYYFGIEATYKFRFKLDGVVVQSGTGINYSKYQITGGASLVGEIDPGDGVWRATGTYAITPAGPAPVTFATGVANVTYSNGNLTITKSAGADGYAVPKDNGRNVWTTDGKYAIAITVNQQTGGDIAYGFNSSNHTFGFNGAGWYLDGNFSKAGYPGITKNGTVTHLIVLVVSGGGTVHKFYSWYSGYGWADHTGNPNNGDAGLDVVGLDSDGAVHFFCNLYKAGDTATTNFGASAWPTTVPAGTVGFGFI